MPHSITLTGILSLLDGSNAGESVAVGVVEGALVLLPATVLGVEELENQCVSQKGSSSRTEKEPRGTIPYLVKHHVLRHHQGLNLPELLVGLLLPLLLNLGKLFGQPSLLDKLAGQGRPALGGPLVAPRLENVDGGGPAAAAQVVRGRRLVGVDLVLVAPGHGLGVHVEAV